MSGLIIFERKKAAKAAETAVILPANIYPSPTTPAKHTHQKESKRERDRDRETAMQTHHMTEERPCGQ